MLDQRKIEALASAFGASLRATAEAVYRAFTPYCANLSRIARRLRKQQRHAEAERERWGWF